MRLRPGPKKFADDRRKKTITVSLSPELIRRLDDLSERTDRSRSRLIEDGMRAVADRLERRAA